MTDDVLKAELKISGTPCASMVPYGSKLIRYQLIRCARKTMEIAVHPDGTVIVKAPLQSDITLIKKKIVKRARWILGQQHYFKQFNPKTPLRCYVNGETHLYLGRKYRLRLVDGKENSVRLMRGRFLVAMQGEPTSEAARKLLDNWYREKARLHFSESMDRCWKKFRGFDVEEPTLLIRRMRSRWGSLSENGTVTLNTDLIRAPKECIDYVVTHELCHLKYPDHGSGFYKLLDSVLPDWEKLKHKLEIGMV
ncbi:M48 family peptidase [Prosthecochloris sp. ZM_2]|nr:M48 family peptidase [Prosthecochloris sp. ZM_2]